MSQETISTIILLAGLLLLVLIRVPIVYAVGISSALCIASMGQNLSTLPQQMVKGTWSFSMMAIPFFITMGVLMGSGGISEKLIGLANSLVGWMRGGLAMVNIVASYFFGGISGSAVAKRPMEKVIKATLPFYLCMIVALLLVSFVPAISMWLPTLAGV